MIILNRTVSILRDCSREEKGRSNITLYNIAYSNDKEGRFFDLYQRLQLDSILPTVNVPYDYNCTLVQTELHKRLHSSKYLKQQKAIIMKTEKQIQVIDGND
ncbi:unnamed protein product, partial [Adineta steineri]